MPEDVRLFALASALAASVLVGVVRRVALRHGVVDHPTSRSSHAVPTPRGGGLGVLLVSHDLHVVMAQSDRVVCVNRHICCSGVPETVARDPSYVRLFGAHAAQAFAIYSHDHDHHHDLTGETLPAAPAADVSAEQQNGA